MAKNMTQDERQLVKLIEKMPFSEEEKNPWLDQIRTGEINNDLIEAIRTRITTPGAAEDDPREQANRTRYLAEFSMLIKRWRLTSQSHNFGKK
jgi:hypothetical protein